MVKRPTACPNCGWPWVVYVCPKCGGFTPRKLSEETIRRLRNAYEQKKQEPKTP